MRTGIGEFVTLSTRQETLEKNTYRATILSYGVSSSRQRMDEFDRSTRNRPTRRSARQPWLFAYALLFVFSVLPSTLPAQDWVKTGTSLGVEKVRLAGLDPVSERLVLGENAARILAAVR